MNIILIHGFGEDHFVWKQFMTLLPAKHTYYTPDYAAFTDCETIEDYVKWLKEFLRERDIERCVLIGHSMGGYIALSFAEKHHEMVHGLGLFHSSAYADDEERKAGRLKTIDFIEKHGSEEFIKDFYPKMFTDDFRKKNKELIESHIERYSTFSKRSLKNAQMAMRNRKDTTKVLKQASYPVMIIAGEEDKFVPVEAAKEQIKLLKKGYTDVLSGVAHAGMFERPEACAKMVETFIAACSHVPV
ncbi:alpha/beta fold hydrolase [Emticicia agri]|uniref:Alpha/beta hydrolase n=1 Tax=Emticicia agri TaxID=2492393 RepID=A0A4Q5M262_9BACT|nr:alpha/beta hydrolase [Emticicia agri]RYU96361.1 alpha/beta hydrolase [Emticicia agri]